MNQFPDQTAALDQLLAAVDGIPGFLWSYYRKLRQAGFTDEQSLELTVAFQRSLLEMSS